MPAFEVLFTSTQTKTLPDGNFIKVEILIEKDTVVANHAATAIACLARDIDRELYPDEVLSQATIVCREIK